MERSSRRPDSELMATDKCGDRELLNSPVVHVSAFSKSTYVIPGTIQRRPALPTPVLRTVAKALIAALVAFSWSSRLGLISIQEQRVALNVSGGSFIASIYRSIAKLASKGLSARCEASTRNAELPRHSMLEQCNL